MRPFLIILSFISLIMLTACPSTPKPEDDQAVTHARRIRVYTLDWHLQSGFTSAVISEFERQNDCAIEITSFQTTADLIAAIESLTETDTLDVVFGLDNAFTKSNDLSAHFISDHGISLDKIERRTRNETESFLIPYAQSNLALLYNTKLIDDPPESFGELQDARFMNQLITFDPSNSGIGRAQLLWSIALFGEYGYEQLWSSLRKNIHGTVNTWNDGLELLKRGEAGLMFGFSGTGTWLSESESTASKVEVNRFREGGFKYVEYAAIHRQSRERDLAIRFVEHLIDPVIQLHTIYKLGLFPANETTTMPVKYASIPLSSYVLNDRLSREMVREAIQTWLLNWERLFSYAYTRF